MEANKHGLFPVMLVLTKNRKRVFVSLGIAGTPDSWDEIQQQFILLEGRSKAIKKQNEERKKKNALIERYNQRAIEVTERFEKRGVDWTLNQFKDAFSNKATQGKIYPYLSAHAKMLRETNHIGNATCYERLMNILSLFDNKFKERVFGEIDIKYVKKFDIYLQKRGNAGNTRKHNFKTLCSILNKAIQDGEASELTYPFGKGGFQISKLEEETEKRYLPSEKLQLLKNSCSLRPVNEYARELFLLSYYCYGISFVDMAHLRANNIITLDEGPYIVYKRQKTKNQPKVKPIQIKITSEINRLMDSLRKFRKPIGSYLLPIVTIDHSGEKLHTHIINKRKRYNIYLKKLAKELELEFNLTSYVSRHTMAMQLQRNAVPREVIGQIMGHSELETTNTYLDSLDSSVIDEAAKKL
ncbi:MAG: site-specific integrase [Carboxylicivirga sp.]|jgi:integrase|nr:site-specific integrase [Carboxylicivirga sp.]